jgi:hypothetical protein
MPIGDRASDVREWPTESAGTAWYSISSLLRKRAPGRGIMFDRTPVNQSPKPGVQIMRQQLADYEWAAIKAICPIRMGSW